jgi:folate-binding protein YgfZ
LQLKQQRIEIYPESRAVFLPHRLGLHQRDYISFNKGCYKGQEIIARTHYKATLKHELKVFTIQTDATLKSGLRLLAPDSDQEIGELVDYAPIGDGLYLIAASILIDSDKHARIDGHMIEWV